MSPPAIPLRAPRTIASVLMDLHYARQDWDQALNAAERAPVGSKEEADAGDRMSEADKRTDELREEFAALFAAATGTEWKRVEAAIQKALL